MSSRSRIRKEPPRLAQPQSAQAKFRANERADAAEAELERVREERDELRSEIDSGEAVAAFEDLKHHERQARAVAEAQAKAYRHRVEQAEKRIEKLEGVLREARHYLRLDRENPDETHAKLYAGCGTDICTACLIEAKIAAALSPDQDTER